MNVKMNLRIKVFFIAVCIIVIAQIGFSVQNVEIFQKSYISTLKAKYEKLGHFLKSDVERILRIGIPLGKLIKMEETLHRTMTSGRELEFIEIVDKTGNVLYFADQDTMERVEKGERPSLMKSPETLASVKQAGLVPDDTNIKIPIVDPGKNQKTGYIYLHIDPGAIVEKSRQIFLDMVTVILTSLLITFELLGFFVAYEISSPLKEISRTMRRSLKNYTPMPVQSFLFMDELCTVVDRFNRHMLKLGHYLTPVKTTRKYFPKVKERLEKRIDKEVNLISKMGKGADPALDDTLDVLTRLKTKIGRYAENLKAFPAHAPLEEDLRAKSRPVHYEFIRPLVFLFVMADGFSISFLPMYIDTLYHPLPGIPREVVLAVPISLFMLTLAVGMPLAGAITDRRGWYWPLIAGIVLNASGHMFTGLSTNLSQLIVFRCITAAGFATVFMACQQFIVANTTVKKRAMGMSSFLAAFFSGDICGTVIGGMLVERIGYSGIFFLSAAFSLLTLGVTFLIFHKLRGENDEKPGTSVSRDGFSIKKLFRIFQDPKFCAVLFFQAIPAKMVMVGVLFYFVPLYLENIQVLQSNIGRIIICYGLSLVFLGPLVSRYLGKVRLRKYNIFTGGMITSAALLAFQFSPGSLTVLAIVLFIGVAHTFSMSSQAALISETRVVKNLGPGTGMGIFRFWERAGNIAGPLVMGYCIAQQGYAAAMTILGGFTLVCSLVYITMLKWKRK
ncbi:MAG: MFS transporter [Desulfarculaceae bacterium]|nr:MFS transporter [Desulfarculaceae bacterium]